MRQLRWLVRWMIIDDQSNFAILKGHFAIQFFQIILENRGVHPTFRVVVIINQWWMIEIFETSGRFTLTNNHRLQHFGTSRVTTQSHSDSLFWLFRSSNWSSGQRTIRLHPIKKRRFIKIEAVLWCISFQLYKRGMIKFFFLISLPRPHPFPTTTHMYPLRLLADLAAHQLRLRLLLHHVSQRIWCSHDFSFSPANHWRIWNYLELPVPDSLRIV